MISRLQGLLLEKKPPTILIDVQGVGYDVHAPMSTIYELPDVKQTVVLLTQLIVREDNHSLYGFLTNAERDLFRNLLKVNGVGPRMALAILSGMNPNEFGTCVSDNNVTALTKIPGVGKKTAERLIIEMRDKVNVTAVSDSGSKIGVADAKTEASQALESLGYKPAEVSRMLAKIKIGVDDSSDDIIRQALKSTL